MYKEKIEKIKILVIGDIMLDKYVVGEVNRISPEAPVQIVDVKEEYSTLGGSGNVVRNIRELGVKVDCLASIGNDSAGLFIKNKLKEIEVRDLTFFGSERTITKERIIAEHRLVQMLRIDREAKNNIPAEIIINKLKTCTKNDYNMIVISDYAKGMITYKLMKYLKEHQNTKIIVDPKPENGFMYNNVFMITPNEKEWGSMQVSSAYILDKVKYILQTRGPKGMRLIEGDETWDIKAEPVDIYNVSGAGDTVVAVMAVCLSIGWNPLDAANIANKCAGYVITQPGTSIVPKNKFTDIIESYIQGDF